MNYEKIPMGRFGFDKNLKEWNQMGAAIICWELILVLFSTIYLGIYFSFLGIPQDSISYFFDVEYVDFLIGSFFAILPILVFRQTDFFDVDLKAHERKFSWRAFGILFMFTMVASIFSSMGINFVDSILQSVFHYSLSGAEDAASASSTTITVFLYSVVAAPICEELVFRGAVMRSLEKYGVGFSIVVSSLLFGIMHGNMVQLIDASIFGLFLGIAAKRYGIGMSILLHAAGNFMAEIFSQMEEITSLVSLSNSLYTVLLVGSVVGCVLFIINHNKEVKDTLLLIRPEQNIAHILRAPFVIIFIIFNIVGMITGLTPVA